MPESWAIMLHKAFIRLQNYLVSGEKYQRTSIARLSKDGASECDWDRRQVHKDKRGDLDFDTAFIILVSLYHPHPQLNLLLLVQRLRPLCSCASSSFMTSSPSSLASSSFLQTDWSLTFYPLFCVFQNDSAVTPSSTNQMPRGLNRLWHCKVSLLCVWTANVSLRIYKVNDCWVILRCSALVCLYISDLNYLLNYIYPFFFKVWIC